MTATGARSTAAVRLATEVLLGTFACWLVVQNLMLLALDPWATRPAALVVAAALVKAAAHLVAATWPLALFLGMMGGAFTLAIASRMIVARARGAEVRHG